MVDTNAPAAWRVIDTETNETVGEFARHDQAQALCMELEPVECIFGYRYIMEPVRVHVGHVQVTSEDKRG